MVRIPSRGRCAVNALADLAARRSDNPVSLASVAARQGISLSYLEQVFAKLRGANLVRSVRGPGGGYRLARPADQITLAEICSVFQSENGNGRDTEASEPVVGAYDLFWGHMQAELDRMLARVSLVDVVARQAQAQAQATPLRAQAAE
ncbi:MAG: Rrf2 family transcriptional regulator [Rhodospirillaceae bacterium]|nr:Rrf2 family transcriptional regulator [Rhodospirillaceae bacterium]